MSEVIPVGEARAALTTTLRGFRSEPEDAEPVVIGSHRRPEAVLLPYAQYRALVDGRDDETADGSVQHLLPELRRLGGVIASLGRANHVADIRVFGSIARGDDHEASDVDLLVTPDRDASLFDLAQFEIDLEQLLGRPVDVVSARGLDPARDAAILAEATTL
ncbi:hypothetical protein ET445_01175 [Agromyces protaetiae]|uniref:Polymerase nucleotidyl transferase domain-containing protein n=1 Tax=Agromyces protaetiae TaxID=2509455 RepID=A0A4V0YGR7_9MICO|nr:nucleotidyltransferase domain-containing protein [Agromyces protaetiae]QAY72151.1 hypothetical protein ET445_01175 [Agromyces protaetiae]